MPIIKSALKRVRQTTVRTARNARTKRDLKQARRALEAALALKNARNLSELLSNVQSQLDISVKKHRLHQNLANRLKARYARQVKAAGGKLSKKAAKPAPSKARTSKAKARPKQPVAKKSSAKK